MITATTKHVPVRIIAWDSRTYDVTVQSLASGRIRCVGFSALQATGGYAELLRVLRGKAAAKPVSEPRKETRL